MCLWSLVSPHPTFPSVLGRLACPQVHVRLEPPNARFFGDVVCADVMEVSFEMSSSSTGWA